VLRHTAEFPVTPTPATGVTVEDRADTQRKMPLGGTSGRRAAA
jgi:hypothetical protein